MADAVLPGGINIDELTSKQSPHSSHVPPSLAPAEARLNFPPSYVVVGVYRLATDKSLFKPVWDKCKHGFVRGAVVGTAWVRFPVLLTGLRVPMRHVFAVRV